MSLSGDSCLMLEIEIGQSMKEFPKSQLCLKGHFRQGFAM